MLKYVHVGFLVVQCQIRLNPILKGLKFIPTEAAQLPRTLGSAAIAVVPGNYAISSGLSLRSAITLEELTEDTKIVVAVRTDNVNQQWAKDIISAVESETFHKALEDKNNIFSSFQKPDWYKQKWNIQ